MPVRSSFEFAVIRVVPRVEREEFLNAGVILFCLEQRFLKTLLHLDSLRLAAICPGIDTEFLRLHLDAYPRVCEASPDAGPVAALSIRERFYWLVSPRSTVIQVSPVHSGLCEDPELALQDLYMKLAK